MDSLMDDQRHHSLNGKPKVFFFQSCRGGMCFLRDIPNHSYGPARTVTDIDADVLVMHATQPAYTSFRNHYNGTWFIQALCRELNKFRFNGFEENLLKLLLRVIKRVSKMGIRNPNGEIVGQTPSLTTTFGSTFILKVKNI